MRNMLKIEENGLFCTSQRTAPYFFVQFFFETDKESGGDGQDPPNIWGGSQDHPTLLPKGGGEGGWDLPTTCLYIIGLPTYP